MLTTDGKSYVGESNCPKCRKPYVYFGDPISTDLICKCPKTFGFDPSEKYYPPHIAYYQNWLRYGWICPICGVANSPDEKQCSCKLKEKH